MHSECSTILRNENKRSELSNRKSELHRLPHREAENIMKIIDDLKVYF